MNAAPARVLLQTCSPRRHRPCARARRAHRGEGCDWFPEAVVEAVTLHRAPRGSEASSAAARERESESRGAPANAKTAHESSTSNSTLKQINKTTSQPTKPPRASNLYATGRGRIVRNRSRLIRGRNREKGKKNPVVSHTEIPGGGSVWRLRRRRRARRSGGCFGGASPRRVLGRRRRAWGWGDGRVEPRRSSSSLVGRNGEEGSLWRWRGRRRRRSKKRWRSVETSRWIKVKTVGPSPSASLSRFYIGLLLLLLQALIMYAKCRGWQL